MTCYWCDKPNPTEILVAEKAGVRFVVHLHTRVCKKKWIEDAAKHDTKIRSEIN